MEKGLLSYGIIRKKDFLPQLVICGICHRMSFCKCVYAIENGSKQKLHNDRCSLSSSGFMPGARMCFLFSGFMDTHLVGAKMLFVCDSSYPVTDCWSFQYESHWSKHCMMPISCLILLVVTNKASLFPPLPCTSYLALDDHSFPPKTKPTFKVRVTPPALPALVCSCCQLLFSQSSGFKLTSLPDTGRLPFGYIHWIWL